jgi:putative flippase GtrA
VSGTHRVGRRAWARFAEKRPKLALLAIQFVKFYLFSLAVTLLQYLMLTLLPEVFISLTDWGSHDCYLIPVFDTGYHIFNYSAADGGMAYFAAYAVTLFVAQCVNFPMQRNIVFKSHGNAWYQGMWYLIAFIVIFIVCNGLQAFYMPYLQEHLGGPAIYNIVITVVNGGVQMVVYFPIYKIIFSEAGTARGAGALGR